MEPTAYLITWAGQMSKPIDYAAELEQLGFRVISPPDTTDEKPDEEVQLPIDLETLPNLKSRGCSRYSGCPGFYLDFSRVRDADVFIAIVDGYPELGFTESGGCLGCAAKHIRFGYALALRRQWLLRSLLVIGDNQLVWPSDVNRFLTWEKAQKELRRLIYRRVQGS